MRRALAPAVVMGLAISLFGPPSPALAAPPLNDDEVARRVMPAHED